MVGGFYPRKDYATFLKSAINILDKKSEVTFLAVGDGPNLRDFQENIPKEYRKRILFPGRQDNIESIINLFTVGVLTTMHDVHEEGILRQRSPSGGSSTRPGLPERRSSTVTTLTASLVEMRSCMPNYSCDSVRINHWIGKQM